MIVWLASYPRSGNTLARIILHSVFGIQSASVYGDRNDIGKNSALADAVGHTGGELDAAAIQMLRAGGSVHAVKTHDPPGEIISADDRIVYILRDGRDAVVSYFHYLRSFGSTRLDGLEQVAVGAVPWGLWADHVEAWQAASFPRRLTVRYEDLVQHQTEAIGVLSAFLGIEPKDAVMPSFETLSALDERFFRKGVAGSWTSELSGDAEIAFWLHNGRAMFANGYREGLPETLAPLLWNPALTAFDAVMRRARERLSDRDAEIKARNERITELSAELSASTARLAFASQIRTLEPVSGLRHHDGNRLGFPTQDIFWKTAGVATMNISCRRSSNGLIIAYFNARSDSVGTLSANGCTATFSINQSELRTPQVAYVPLPLQPGSNELALGSEPFALEHGANGTPLYFIIAAIAPL